METARLVETVVLPTPPLPPVTAITLTGREELSSRSLSACVLVSRSSRMGSSSSEVAGIVGIVAGPGRAPRELVRGAHQPDAAVMGRVHVLRHPLPVAEIGDLELVPERGRNDRAQARRLVH